MGGTQISPLRERWFVFLPDGYVQSLIQRSASLVPKHMGLMMSPCLWRWCVVSICVQLTGRLFPFSTFECMFFVLWWKIQMISAVLLVVSSDVWRTENICCRLFYPPMFISFNNFEQIAHVHSSLVRTSFNTVFTPAPSVSCLPCFACSMYSQWILVFWPLNIC